MPEYLSPGVYVEETSFRSKSIEGVSTSTAGFIGPARFGPIDLVPDIITSLGEFERTYGDGQRLNFAGGSGTWDNFLWHAARAFFAEGGKRLYIARTFRRAQALTSDDGTEFWNDLGPDGSPASTAAGYADGYARTQVAGGSPLGDELALRARYPGSGGNRRVRIALRLGENIRSGTGASTRLQGVSDRDTVALRLPGGSALGVHDPFYVVRQRDDGTWALSPDGTTLDGVGVTNVSALANDVQVYPVSVSVAVAPAPGRDPSDGDSWEGLALDPEHRRSGAPDSLTAFFGSDGDPERRRALPIVVGAAMSDGAAVATALIASNDALVSAPSATTRFNEWVAAVRKNGAFEVTLTGGNDGSLPTDEDYEGEENVSTARKTGLEAFKDLDDISIVAAPGSTFGDRDRGDAIARLLITHAETMRYRIAVLDSVNSDAIVQVRRYRAKFDSKYAALYYPWVKVLDPITRVPLALPPSGFVAGIYARNDIERAVYKAPANEVVRLAQGFELTLNKSQQDVLNPEGINCFRFFEGRGNRLWGARTISSDPEWKYVNLRRYFAYLEHSIDKGTQWAVFEPNGERLWANVRRTIEDFLFNEYQNGALLGDRPDRAYFVRCDRSTMTQNDLDNGRLVCLIGVAPLRPAEFVIFRIGQWTGDRRA